ncbi:MAG: sigma-70 family RNA polymerase sigma factor, partial [Bacteroidota bacterium]
VSDELRSQVGREVSAEEIRRKLDVSPEKYQSYLHAAAAAKASLSLSEPTSLSRGGDEDTDPLEEIADMNQEDFLTKIENEERINFLTDMLKNLNERKRLVMMLYYYENLTFKDIGKVLNVSESRICQIHTQVVSDMRKKLYEFDNA